MILFESRRVRRIVGRLERGEEVVRAVEDLVREREVTTAWVRATGTLDWVELRRYDARARRWSAAERVEAPCEIVALEGQVAFEEGERRARLSATLRRESVAGAVVFGGEIVRAGVFALDLLLDCMDDLGLRRERDAETGLSLFAGLSVPLPAAQPGRTVEPAWEPEPEPEPSAAPAPAGDGSISWAQAAAVTAAPDRSREPPGPRRGRGRRSVLTEAREPAPVPQPLPDKKRVSEEEFFEEPIPDKGDWVDHRVFGMCKVEGEDAQGGILIRLPSGARKVINLGVLEVLPARIEGDRLVYPLRPRRR